MQPDNRKTILCYGDSNTYGYDPQDGLRYAEDIRWPGVLRQVLGNGYRIIEEGCNGRTCAHTPEDEEWKDGRPYLKACLNSHKPIDAVVLMLGSNDLKRQFAAEPETLAAGIGWMMSTIAEFLQLKQGSVPYILVVSPPRIGEGITSSPFADSFEADAAPRSQRLASLYEKTAFDYAQETMNPCGFLDAASLIEPSQIDSLHLMPDAHQVLGTAIAQTLRAFL